MEAISQNGIPSKGVIGVCRDMIGLGTSQAHLPGPETKDG